jgi:5S rRNA maturation endonuclease (ribonuclease M5)
VTAREFIEGNPIGPVLEARGVKVLGAGPECKAKCPFHEDKNPSFSVNYSKSVWICRAGCGGGSVIDLLAKFDGKDPVRWMKDNGIGADEHEPARGFMSAKPAAKALPKLLPNPESKVVKDEVKKVIECRYDYVDAFGKMRYQTVRLKPKDFRQRRPEKGQWVWDMHGVERVLYNLPAVLREQEVISCEGEKDSDNLNKLGFTATTSVGGASNWLDSYAETLTGKDVVICGDNDEPGRKYVEAIFASLAGKAKTVKLIELPKHIKDVSDYIAEIADADKARKALREMIDAAHPHIKGYRLPLYTMADLEPKYIRHVTNLPTRAFDLVRWLPGLAGKVRPLVPGDLAVIIGDTGAGKTAALQGLAFAALPLPTLLCELELSDEMLFERFVAMNRRVPCVDVESAYAGGEGLGRAALEMMFRNLLLCTESGLTMDKIEEYIMRSELKLGQRPMVTVVDYIQLTSGSGERRERVADAAERAKVIAKRTDTIIILGSQVHRPKEGEKEIGLHSAKESGSIENSAGLVLGLWRDAKDETLLYLKGLKNTRGRGGFKLECDFDGARMLITERASKAGIMKSQGDGVPEPKEDKPDKKGKANYYQCVGLKENFNEHPC